MFLEIRRPGLVSTPAWTASTLSRRKRVSWLRGWPVWALDHLPIPMLPHDILLVEIDPSAWGHGVKQESPGLISPDTRQHTQNNPSSPIPRLPLVTSTQWGTCGLFATAAFSTTIVTFSIVDACCANLAVSLPLHNSSTRRGKARHRISHPSCSFCPNCGAIPHCMRIVRLRCHHGQPWFPQNLHLSFPASHRGSCQRGSSQVSPQRFRSTTGLCT